MVFVFADCSGSVPTILGDMLLIVFGAAVTYAVQIPGILSARKRKRAYVLLSGFWESGVMHLNRGMQHLSQRKRKAWYESMDKWQNELYEVVEKHLPEKLGTVRTVGLFPEIQPYALADKKAINKLSELWATLQRLKKVLDDYRD